jgi:hypothetical protein
MLAWKRVVKGGGKLLEAAERVTFLAFVEDGWARMINTFLGRVGEGLAAAFVHALLFSHGERVGVVQQKTNKKFCPGELTAWLNQRCAEESSSEKLKGGERRQKTNDKAPPRPLCRT